MFKPANPETFPIVIPGFDQDVSDMSHQDIFKILMNCNIEDNIAWRSFHHRITLDPKRWYNLEYDIYFVIILNRGDWAFRKWILEHRSTRYPMMQRIIQYLPWWDEWTLIAKFYE